MESVELRPNSMSRRNLLKAITSAGVAVAVSSQATATVPPPVCYGVGAGKVSVKPETIFPLLAAWLLLTTNGDFVVDEQTIGCAANLHPDCAKIISDYYAAHASVFSPVRAAFETIVSNFSKDDPHPFYSGGQCPKDADTVTPIAALFGTPTVVVCNQQRLPNTKKKMRKPGQDKK